MYKIIRPLLFALNPEYVHDKVIDIGRYLSSNELKEIFRLVHDFRDERLETEFCGINFSNPVGLAAGFDKNGEVIEFMSCLGFGFVEIGSVTAQESEGNPKPRIFRLFKDRAIVNREGLNNNGVNEIVRRLENKNFDIPIGINIAKTNDDKILGEDAIKDFCYSFGRIYDVGNYITINIGCPNTRDGRTFEDKTALEELLSALGGVKRVYKKPTLIKFSPDLSYRELDGILEVSERHVEGYVICNTNLERENLRTSPRKILRIGEGGLSGRPIRKKSTEMIGYVYRNLNKPNIIGVGGIASAEDAYHKILAGASLVQTYTGLIYEGPGLVKKIKKGIIELIEREGFSSVKEAVGSANS